MPNIPPGSIIDEPQFRLLKGIIEATDFEVHCLWKDYADTAGWMSRLHETPRFTWQRDEERPGCMITIDRIRTRPICVCFMFIRVGGYPLAFWDATSQLVDSKLIDDWFGEHFDDLPKTTASNFINIMHELQRQERNR